jgi:hypothetical protein
MSSHPQIQRLIHIDLRASDLGTTPMVRKMLLHSRRSARRPCIGMQGGALQDIDEVHWARLESHFEPSSSLTWTWPPRRSIVGPSLVMSSPVQPTSGVSVLNILRTLNTQAAVPSRSSSRSGVGSPLNSSVGRRGTTQNMP